MGKNVDRKAMFQYVVSQVKDLDQFLEELEKRQNDHAIEKSVLLLFKDGRIFERSSRPNIYRQKKFLESGAKGVLLSKSKRKQHCKRQKKV